MLHVMPLAVRVDEGDFSSCPWNSKSAGLIITEEVSTAAIGRYPGVKCRAKNSLNDRQPPRGIRYSERQNSGLASNVARVSGWSDSGVFIKISIVLLKWISYLDTKESSLEESGVTGLWYPKIEG